MSQQETGIVKWFSDEKGYGFITRSNGQEIFVHHTGIEGSGYKKLMEGESVTFVIGEGRKGPAAQQVRRSQGS